MALPADYISGTITLTNGSSDFTGTGTGWQAADFREGDILLGVEDHAGQVYVIAAITGNAAGTLTQEWAGTSGTYTYRMRYEWDSSRVSAQARAMVELLGNGNLESIAGLTGPGVVVLEGPHSAGIRPFADFINGVTYDVQVDTLADRDDYDGQTEGFAVLVSNVGDGRSAVYSKASNTSGDWTDPAYITGPEGPAPEIEATVDTLPPGSTATVTPTPIAGGVRLDFELPEASGFYNAGVYDIAEAYSQDDVVRHNGSSFIALQAVPIGESPSSAMPPVDTAYWQVLAAKGTDGAGTGDVVGPPGAVEDHIAVFDGTTGNLIKDGGVTVSQLVPADGSITNAKLADMAQATVKGRASGAGVGVPTDLSAAQLLAITQGAGAYGRSNILGTVSQSGGEPTGAIIESGSNANGEYVRFADGTQICTFTLTTSGSAFTTCTLPATFVNADYSPVGASSNSTSASQFLIKIGGRTTTSFDTAAFQPGASYVSLLASYVVIGRWF